MTLWIFPSPTVKPISLSIIFAAHFHRSNVLQFNSNSFLLPASHTYLRATFAHTRPVYSVSTSTRSINIFNGLLPGARGTNEARSRRSIEAREDGAPTLHYRYIDKDINQQETTGRQSRSDRKNNGFGNRSPSHLRKLAGASKHPRLLSFPLFVIFPPSLNSTVLAKINI